MFKWLSINWPEVVVCSVIGSLIGLAAHAVFKEETRAKVQEGVLCAHPMAGVRYWTPDTDQTVRLEKHGVVRYNKRSDPIFTYFPFQGSECVEMPVDTIRQLMGSVTEKNNNKGIDERETTEYR